MKVEWKAQKMESCLGYLKGIDLDLMRAIYSSHEESGQSVKVKP